MEDNKTEYYRTNIKRLELHRTDDGLNEGREDRMVLNEDKKIRIRLNRRLQDRMLSNEDPRVRVR